jgi:hypothetical protein
VHGLRWYSKDRFTGKKIITEFTLIGSLNVQINKKGLFLVFDDKYKTKGCSRINKKGLFTDIFKD